MSNILFQVVDMFYFSTRLVEIAKARFSGKYKDCNALSHLMKNIHIYNEMTCKDLMKS